MIKQRLSVEQIVGVLKQAEVGAPVVEVILRRATASANSMRSRVTLAFR